MKSFAERVIEWQQASGRHDLPWQGTRNAYRIWLSEIMLQQTQVAAVIPYYQRFLDCFPELASLAAATEDEVLAQWSGLGYYARARNLHRAARVIMERHNGVFPDAFDDILALPGIGRSTASMAMQRGCWHAPSELPVFRGRPERRRCCGRAPGWRCLCSRSKPTPRD
jgi:A/G-specific adenine glycosylase